MPVQQDAPEKASTPKNNKMSTSRSKSRSSSKARAATRPKAPKRKASKSRSRSCSRKASRTKKRRTSKSRSRSRSSKVPVASPVDDAQKPFVFRSPTRGWFQRWNKNELNFACWTGDTEYDPIRSILKERGWTDIGNPIESGDLGDLSTLCKDGKFKGQKLPRSCMYWADHWEATMYSNLLPTTKGKYIICKFPGVEPACYKTNFARNMGDACPAFPRSFALPQDKSSCLAHLGKPTNQQELLICKPRIQYGGRGITVHRNSQKFRTSIESGEFKEHIVQKYIANPLTVDGFKFHCRVHLVCTSFSPMRAFVHTGDSYTEFATVKYENPSERTGEDFCPQLHITNEFVNLGDKGTELTEEAKKHYDMKAQRPWLVSQLTDLPKWDAKKFFWTPCLEIARQAMLAVGRHAHTLRKVAEIPSNRNWEVFGMDLLLSEDYQLHLLEVNDSPGLGFAAETTPDGTPIHGSLPFNKSNKEFIHDMFRLLGLDDSNKGSLENWVQVC